MVHSERLRPDRLKIAKAVEVRDGAPLQNLADLLEDLCTKTSSDSGLIALATEEDIPLAFFGDIAFPIQLREKDEDVVLSGKHAFSNDSFIQPFFHNKHVVGYLKLTGSFKNSDASLIGSLISVYSKLASKELELADKTAKLQYQNENIMRKQKQLEQAIAFKNNILSLTTHDLRSPLNAVKGYLEMMEFTLSNDFNTDQLRDYHSQITKGIDNISDMVDQLNEIALLELQRIELNLIKVDLNWVVQEVSDVMQGPALSKNQSLKVQRSEKPLYVEIDIPKAKRIVFNLISNAIKYTKHEGTISIELREHKGMANVEIKDNGIGIPREKLHTIFEPFQKLNSHGTHGEMSTGLGLFTCSYFTRLFKGSLTVDSEVDKGSMFCLHLPLAKIGF